MSICSLAPTGSTTGSWKRLRYCNSQLECQSQGAKHRTSFMAQQPLIFHNMGFLLTGFSTSKEKEIEKLIQKHGGEVLLDIPPVNLRRKGSSKVLSKQQTFVISPRKVFSLRINMAKSNSLYVRWVITLQLSELLLIFWSSTKYNSSNLMREIADVAQRLLISHLIWLFGCLHGKIISKFAKKFLPIVICVCILHFVG